MKTEALDHSTHAGTPADIRWLAPDQGRSSRTTHDDTPLAQPSPLPPLDSPPPSVAPPHAPPRAPLRRLYVAALTWAFMLFTTARLLAYAPTMLAILHTRDSSQHSLWTWLTWFGANLTMAAWLYENNGQRFDKAIGVSLSNAAACGFTALVILYFR